MLRRGWWWPCRRSRAGAGAGQQAGQALMLIVLAAMALMGTVPLVVIASTVHQLPLSTDNLNWNAAYEAAQAGLNDYLQQVDAEASYTEWTSGATLCTGTTPVAAPSGPGNEAFCTWASSTTSTAPLSTNPDEWYEYSVSTASGKVILTVSGKGGSGPDAVVRTFQYDVAPVDATLDDIYWTNHELPSGCNSPSCAIYFDSGDVLNGPVFSNDYFNMDGTPTFNSTVASSAATAPYWRCENGGGQWVYGSSCSPSYATPVFNGGTPVSMPAEDIITDGTSPDVNPAETLGCYIAGPSNTSTGVQIDLTGTTLTWTDAAGYAHDPATVQNSSSNPNNTGNVCGTSGAGSNTITLSNLRTELIYVNGDIVLPGGAADGAAQGFLTLVASGNVDIDGDITYTCADISWQSGGTCASPTSEGTDTHDALGIIAEDNINVVESDIYPNNQGQSSSTQINAAMVAVTGSFQNADATDACSSGTVTGSNPEGCPQLVVFGSIAQNYRGVVAYLNGSGDPDEGYAKDYVYDISLQTLWPPFFIPPSGATWAAMSYEELKPGSANEAIPGT